MKYPGNELDLFQNALAWKTYFSKFLKPYLKGAVLEVGGGIGGTTSYLMNPDINSYTVLEPDPDLFQQLEERCASAEFPTLPTCLNGYISDLSPDARFDAIAYIDVVEHIPDDKKELALADRFLNPGGRLLILSPAFSCLWSPFDEAVGHVKRYTKSSLADAIPEGYELEEARYLDAVGAGLSLGNRLLKKDSHPTKAQINLWCRYCLPLSRVLDPLLHAFWGRSVLVIARKPLNP